MGRLIVTSDRIAPAVGPFSAAVLADGFVFLSGQIALDPSTGMLVHGDVAAQTERIFEHLAAAALPLGAAVEIELVAR